MSFLNLNEFAKEVNQANREKGFYEDYDKLISLTEEQQPELLQFVKQLFFAQRIALIQSEASEALEANRKGQKVNPILDTELFESMDDDAFKESFETKIKDTQEDEIADTFIRLLDLSGELNIDLDFHITAKLRYNALRPHKHGKKY